MDSDSNLCKKAPFFKIILKDKGMLYLVKSGGSMPLFGGI